MRAVRAPADHPERRSLADEVHARPPMPVRSPARVAHVSVLIDATQRSDELRHVQALCEGYGAPAPDAQAGHHVVALGPLQFKWERHGEFSGFTFLLAEADAEPDSQDLFARSALDDLPEGWLAGIPGLTVAASHAVVRSPQAATSISPAMLSAHFDGHTVVGSEVAEGAGVACADFRIRPDGFSRLLLLDRHFTPNQTGRILQRLFEIEAYRVMALLALPIARRLSPRILSIEKSLAALTDGIARDHQDTAEDERLLSELTRLAAEVESGLSASQFRFGACRAYADLVAARIGELRERRFPGVQTIDEFMTRRFRPAVQTCHSVSQRLHDLSDRVAQASGLLRARVDIARERQNQALLGSMDRRARLQLRLQQTVEGLSVAAIAYYVAGLIGYLAKGAQSLGWPVDADLTVGLSLPLVAFGLILGLRRTRRKMRHEEP